MKSGRKKLSKEEQRALEEEKKARERKADFIEALDVLEEDRHIPKAVIIDSIEAALEAAYKKNYGTSQNVRVVVDEESGEARVYARMDVVEEVVDEMTQMSVEEARTIDERYEAGDYIEFQIKPEDFGRIAAQTAKQVVVQRIREAERGMVFDNFKEHQGEILTGTVRRKSGNTLFVDVARSEGILPVKEQVSGEHFNVGDRIKVYIMDVKRTNKGPQVFLSRSHPGLVKKLFELEVPEIKDGLVEIRGIAREAGSRTKMAVFSPFEDIDPVGACVGARGSRVQAVVDELSGEKIDIIPWSDVPEDLIAAVLSPAQVEEVYLFEEEKAATAIVPDFQLSLAIGKEGQNVRLAARVSGWKIDIKSHSQYYGDEENNPIEELNEAFDEYAEEQAETAEDLQTQAPAAEDASVEPEGSVPETEGIAELGAEDAAEDAAEDTLADDTEKEGGADGSE